MHRSRRTNFQHFNRQILRVNLLNQRKRNSKCMCKYFHRCIYQRRFVKEICKSSSIVRLYSILQPWLSVRKCALEANPLKCIQPFSYTKIIINQPKVSAVVLEGSVLINLVKPKKHQSLKVSSTMFFYARVWKQTNECSAERVNAVFVVHCAIWYHLCNLKNVKNTH